MKGKMLRTILSAFIAGATTLSSMPVSVFAETAGNKNMSSDNAHTDEHEHDHACDEEHNHCGEDEELFLGNGINVAVLDSGITNYESAKEISFVDDAEFSEHANMMADVLINEVPEIAVYDVRVLDSEGKGKYSDISEAIVWSVNNDADIIVMSFEGYEASTLLEDAVKYAAENDVLMIAAAGNDINKETIYPAAYPTVISAGVVDESGEVSGDSVDIYVEAVGGTSFAAQYVAADAVRYMQENPDADSEEVRNALTYNKVKNYTGESSAVDGTVYAAACSHNYRYSSTVKPKCGTQGYDIYKCTKSRCGATTKKNYKSSLGHNYQNKQTAKPATCTTDGVMVQACSRCSSTKNVPIKAYSHNYKYNKTVAPKCTTQGYDLYKCTRSGCTASYKSNYKSVLGHNYKNKQTAKPATCTTDGVMVQACSRCSSTKNVPIKAYSHNYKYNKTVAPQCTTQGYELHKCSRSGCTSTTKKNYKAATGHNLVNYTYKPTCTAEGYSYKYCTRTGCKYKTDKTNVVSALGHNYKNKQTAKPATCTTDGVMVQACSRCSSTKNVPIKAYGHYYKYNKTVAPKCTAQGYELHKCTRSGCTSTIKKNYKSATGHNYKNKQTAKPATCTTNGVMIQVCANSGCTSTRNVTIKAYGHNYSWVTKVAPTCTKTGTRQYKCTRSGCGNVSKTETIPKLGHKLSDWRYIKPVSDTENGTKIRECTRANCSYKEVKSICSNNTHRFDYPKYLVTISPTATRTGEKERTCQLCGYKDIVTMPKVEKKNYTVATAKPDANAPYGYVVFNGKNYPIKIHTPVYETQISSPTTIVATINDNTRNFDWASFIAGLTLNEDAGECLGNGVKGNVAGTALIAADLFGQAGANISYDYKAINIIESDNGAYYATISLGSSKYENNVAAWGSGKEVSAYDKAINVAARSMINSNAKALYEALTNKKLDSSGTYDIIVNLDSKRNGGRYSTNVYIDESGNECEWIIPYKNDKVYIAERCGLLNSDYKIIYDLSYLFNPEDERYIGPIAK